MFNATILAKRKHIGALPGIAAAVAGVVALTAPVHAQMLPQGVAAVAILQANCAFTGALNPEALAVSTAQAVQPKAEAILGGAPSALERIRQQQAGVEQALATPTASTAPLSARFDCGPTKVDLAAAPAIPPKAGEDENFLDSSRIAIRKTSFTADWDRVSSNTISADEVRSYVGDIDGEDANTLQSVNGWVNHAISYSEDRVTWNSSDYWALASQTLRRREGDCEDVAILKYQMLRALGVAPEDMFLTLARDLARNADHAVLIVRLNGSFFLLDNATDAILPANLSYDYRPTLSFSGDSSWLHGVNAIPVRQPSFLMLSQSDVETARNGLQQIG